MFATPPYHAGMSSNGVRCAVSNPLLERLCIAHPLLQAPMAGVSTPALAAAVSDAGALGAIGIGASAIDAARTMIEDTRALTDAPFNVNVFCHAPARRDAARETAWIARLAPEFDALGAPVPDALHEIYPSFRGNDAMLALLLALRPAVVSMHFGLPDAAQLDALRAAGIVMLASATNLDEARAIERAGIDAIVAQGIEAGGHRGVFDPDARDECLPTATLTRLLVQRTGLPVIAAGGIMDGRGIRAALDLGASAAQLGTAFIACPESAASAGHRAALQDARAWRTRLTRVLSGRPARGIANRFIDGFDAVAGDVADYPVAYDAAKQLSAAAGRRGLADDFAAHWAGQGAPLSRAMPAGALVRQLLDEHAG